jgi:hypothetical protein
MDCLPRGYGHALADGDGKGSNNRSAALLAHNWVGRDMFWFHAVVVAEATFSRLASVPERRI